MAEAANGRVATVEATSGALPATPSVAEARAAIRETRGRLAVRVARTANHVHRVFTDPSSAAVLGQDGGAIGRAIGTIAVAGRARRAWRDARSTGLLRRAAIGGVCVAVAVAFAVRMRRRPAA